MIERVTIWTQDSVDVLQVAVAYLDDSWEPLAEVTKPVGPFDFLDTQEAAAAGECRNLVRGQLRGQQELWTKDFSDVP